MHTHPRLISTFLLLVIVECSFPQEQVSVTNVSVWVKATASNGLPVRGLKQSDFKVYEDGKEVPLTCFEEVGSSLNELPQVPETDQKRQLISELPSAPRKAVLFLDLYNTSMAEFRGISKYLREFLKQINNGNWSVMLGVITNNGRAGVVVPFTVDSNKVSNAVRQQQPNAQRDIAVISRKREISRLLELGSSSRDTIERAYSLAAQFAKQEKFDAEKSLSAFPALGNYLKPFLQGEHVSVIFVSGGINVEPGRQYYEIVNKVVDRLGMSLNAPELALQMPVSNREPNFDLRNEVRKSIGILGRQNITVYCINARGSMNPGLDNIEQSNPDLMVNDPTLLGDFQETLDQVASETGGLSFKNSNNFSLGFDRVLQDSDHQYIVCYNSPGEKKKNEYREIKVVSLKSGINLRHRKGYVP